MLFMTNHTCTQMHSITHKLKSIAYSSTSLSSRVYRLATESQYPPGSCCSHDRRSTLRMHASAYYCEIYAAHQLVLAAHRRHICSQSCSDNTSCNEAVLCAKCSWYLQGSCHTWNKWNAPYAKTGLLLLYISLHISATINKRKQFKIKNNMLKEYKE